MKNLSLVALALLVCAPSYAQNFFGMTSSDVEGAIAQVRAEEHLERLRALGMASNPLQPVEQALGFKKTLTSRQDCIFEAVESQMRVTEIRPGTEFPDVLYASAVDSSRYQAAVKYEYPSANPTSDVASIYLPGANVIYIADSSSAYKKGGTIDSALAGQYARFLDRTQRGVSDAALIDADAAAVSAWYDAQYPAGRSSCTR
jgi:hypothetical protein